MRNEQKPERHPGAQTEAELALIHEASRFLGWVVPTSEKEVLIAERDLDANPVILPERLRDPKDLFDQPGRSAPQTGMLAHFPDNPQVGATLARAAREAGRLTPEVEERMQRDRKAAEERQDKDRHGKNVRQGF